MTSQSDWRDEFECEKCRQWTGKPPVPIGEAGQLLGANGVTEFKLVHACYLRVDRDGNHRHIPTTILELPDGTTTQWIPELPDDAGDQGRCQITRPCLDSLSRNHARP